MKLDVAVVNAVAEENERNQGTLRRTAGARSLALVLAVAGWVLLGMGLSGSAAALDLEKAAAAPAAGECPELIKVKYPFLSCENGQIKTPTANATWENSRQIPRQSDFIEGDGAWGPEMHQD